MYIMGTPIVMVPPEQSGQENSLANPLLLSPLAQKEFEISETPLGASLRCRKTSRDCIFDEGHYRAQIASTKKIRPNPSDSTIAGDDENNNLSSYNIEQMETVLKDCYTDLGDEWEMISNEREYRPSAADIGRVIIFEATLHPIHVSNEEESGHQEPFSLIEEDIGTNNNNNSGKSTPFEVNNLNSQQSEGKNISLDVRASSLPTPTVPHSPDCSSRMNNSNNNNNTNSNNNDNDNKIPIITTNNQTATALASTTSSTAPLPKVLSNIPWAPPPHSASQINIYSSVVAVPSTPGIPQGYRAVRVRTGCVVGPRVIALPRRLSFLIPPPFRKLSSNPPPGMTQTQQAVLAPLLPNKTSSMPSAGQNRIRVLSWNVLADIYTTSEAFPYCEPYALSWPFRRERIMEEILLQNADVVCLQEVQAEHFSEYFVPVLAQYGYIGRYKAKTSEIFTPGVGKRRSGKMTIDGCATFFRKSSFSLIHSVEVEFHKHNKDLLPSFIFDSNNPSGGNSSNNLGGGGGFTLSQAEVKRLLKDNVALLVTLRDNISGKYITVVNTHIAANPEHTDVKLWQTLVLLNAIQKAINFEVPTNISSGAPASSSTHLGSNANNRMGRNLQGSSSFNDASSDASSTLATSPTTHNANHGLIVVGDFNSPPTSAVYCLLAAGRVPLTHADLKPPPAPSNLGQNPQLHNQSHIATSNSLSYNNSTGGGGVNNPGVSSSSSNPPTNIIQRRLSAALREAVVGGILTHYLPIASAYAAFGNACASSAARQVSAGSASLASVAVNAAAVAAAAAAAGGTGLDGSSSKFSMSAVDVDTISRASMSAAGEPSFTNLTAQFSGCLDYLWYSPDTLAVAAVLEPLDESTLRSEQRQGYFSHHALPSPIRPSDHIMMLADFAWASDVPNQQQMSGLSTGVNDYASMMSIASTSNPPSNPPPHASKLLMQQQQQSPSSLMNNNNTSNSILASSSSTNIDSLNTNNASQYPMHHHIQPGNPSSIPVSSYSQQQNMNSSHIQYGNSGASLMQQQQQMSSGFFNNHTGNNSQHVFGSGNRVYDATTSQQQQQQQHQQQQMMNKQQQQQQQQYSNMMMSTDMLPSGSVWR